MNRREMFKALGSVFAGFITSSIIKAENKVKNIIYMRIGDGRKTFYPYGISIIESAHRSVRQLKLMEDAMFVYRLCR